MSARSLSAGIATCLMLGLVACGDSTGTGAGSTDGAAHTLQQFVEIPVPEPIAPDWIAAQPKNPTPPAGQDRVEQTKARATTYQWIVDNCTLSDEIDSELRDDVADDLAYLNESSSPTT